VRAIVLQRIKLDRIYEPGERVSLTPAKVLKLRGLVEPVGWRPQKKKVRAHTTSIFRMTDLKRWPAKLVRQLAIEQLNFPSYEARKMPYKQLIVKIRETMGCRTRRLKTSKN